MKLLNGVNIVYRDSKATYLAIGKNQGIQKYLGLDKDGKIIRSSIKHVKVKGKTYCELCYVTSKGNRTIRVCKRVPCLKKKKPKPKQNDLDLDYIIPRR